MLYAPPAEGALTLFAQARKTAMPKVENFQSHHHCTTEIAEDAVLDTGAPRKGEGAQGRITPPPHTNTQHKGSMPNHREGGHKQESKQLTPREEMLKWVELVGEHL